MWLQSLFHSVVWALVIFFVIWKIYLRLTVGWCRGYRCLVGKTALIIGGNSGIGYQIVLALASRGCRVIIADVEDCTKTKQKIIEETENENIEIKYVNLASFKTVRALAEDIKRTETKLDFLICNSGVSDIIVKPTEDGNPSTIQINYLGHFLITHLLIDLLKKSSHGRIIFTSSVLSLTANFEPQEIRNVKLSPGPLNNPYSISKQCLAIFSRTLAKKLEGTKVTVNAQHPGAVRTRIFRLGWIHSRKENSFKGLLFVWLLGILTKFLGKTPEEGAQTAIHMVCAKELDNVSGKFFSDSSYNHWISFVSEFLLSKLEKKYVEDLWKISEEIVGLKEEEKL